MEIVIKEVSIKDVMSIHKRIPEFQDTPVDKLLGVERYKGKRTLFLAAYIGKEVVGYMAAYDRFADKSFYCWMTGVLPDYRGHGVLSAMMTYLFKWAVTNGFSKIKLKSRNERREMNAFLIKRGFLFTSIETRDDIRDNRICLEHSIEEDYAFEAKV
jgi:GNAT superfamily N-acetyltransferase